MRILRGAFMATAVAWLAIAQLDAVTRVTSADGQFWDIQDHSPWSQDSGGIATGGVRRSDKRLLEIGAAYERATRHRRPPATVR